MKEKNKMKKFIFAIVLMITLVGYANSQVAISEGFYKTNYSLGYKITLDSNATYYQSAPIYWGNLIGQTNVYCHTALVQNHWGYTAGHDTLLIIFVGSDLVGNTQNMDSITIVSNTTQALASTETLLTLTSHYSFVSVYIKPKVSGGNTKNGKSAIFTGSITSFPGITATKPY